MYPTNNPPPPNNNDEKKDLSSLNLNLDYLIEKSFWKDILLEIISELNNPWDIDLVELATRYSKRVDRMKELNFKIPANVIIVSSVLLRMKSDLLTFSGPSLEYDLEEWISAGEFLDEFSSFTPIEENKKITLVDIDSRIPIEVKPRRVPKRRISALELIAAIQEVLEDKERYKKKKEEIEKGKDNNIIIKQNFDIKRLIHETYLRIIEILMKKDVVLFSELVNNSKEEIIQILISLLHLSNNKKLKLIQNELYGEIFIKVM